MADAADERDELIEKLDHLISRSRSGPGTPAGELPVLTEVLPEAAGEPIPTLTEAVAGPGQRQDRGIGRREFELVVAMRLAESIDREISRLASEFPADHESLALLRASVVRSLPALVRRMRSRTGDFGTESED